MFGGWGRLTGHMVMWICFFWLDDFCLMDCAIPRGSWLTVRQRMMKGRTPKCKVFYPITILTG